MEYSVLVDNDSGKSKIYNIHVQKRFSGDVETNSEQDDLLSKDYNQEQSDILNLLVEASKCEYEHSFRRAERLDNKVYILLTVCAFLFVPLTNSIAKLSELPQNNYGLGMLEWVYLILLLACSVLTILLLILLIYSLSGKDFKRFDSFKILENNLFSNYDNKSLSRYIIMKYEMARDHNNEVVTRKFKLLNLAILMLVGDVLLLVSLTYILSIIGLFT